jgi:hypothetical protein
MLRPFGLIAHKDFKIIGFPIVPFEVFSVNVSCALNLISRFK